MTKQELKEIREELRKQLEELKAIEAKVNKEEEEYRFLKLRETKRILYNALEALPLNNVKLSIAGFTVSIRPENKKPIQTESGVVIEKNKTSEKITGKESFTTKVARLSRLHPDIHVTHSDLSYPKAAKAWLTKNFPEELAIS